MASKTISYHLRAIADLLEQGEPAKATAVAKALSAKKSGLVPDGWKVTSDFPEGDVDLAKLDYSLCPVRGSETSINGTTMVARAKEDRAIGSLGLAAVLIAAQDEGKEIFPVESRGKHYFIMPLTELQGDDGNGDVAYFYWSDEEQRWVLDFYWFDDGFSRGGRFVRRSE